MIPGVTPHIKGRLGGVVLDDHALTRGVGGVALDDHVLTRERLGGVELDSPHHQKGKLG